MSSLPPARPRRAPSRVGTVRWSGREDLNLRPPGSRNQVRYQAALRPDGSSLPSNRRMSGSLCSNSTKFSTTNGSNCVPEQRCSSAIASRLRQRLAVRPLRDHRVVGVGDGEDARLERPSARRAGRAGSRRRRSARGAGAIAGSASARKPIGRMMRSPISGWFLITVYSSAREAVLLLDDRQVDADLADVVEHAGVLGSSAPAAADRPIAPAIFTLNAVTRSEWPRVYWSFSSTAWTSAQHGLEVAALDLAVEVRVLDRDRRLVGDGLEHLEVVVEKLSPPAPVRQLDGAEDPVLHPDRHAEHRAAREAEAAALLDALRAVDVADQQRLAAGGDVPETLSPGRERRASGRSVGGQAARRRARRAARAARRTAGSCRSRPAAP